jgi:hypothetical protein
MNSVRQKWSSTFISNTSNHDLKKKSTTNCTEIWFTPRWCWVLNSSFFLQGAFYALSQDYEKATISVISFLCLYIRMEHLDSHWTHFDETWCLSPPFQMCRESSGFIKIWLEKQIHNMKTFSHVWQYVAKFFLEWELFYTKVTEKVKTHILWSIFFFFLKSCRLWDIVEKCGAARGVTNYITVWRIRVPCWISKATCTHKYIILIACLVKFTMPLKALRAALKGSNKNECVWEYCTRTCTSVQN